MSEMACPKCASTDVECQPRPHVHRCHACGFDGTCDSVDDLAILGSVLNQTIAERDAERALADEALAIARDLCRTHPDPYDTAYQLDQLEARYREARRR